MAQDMGACAGEGPRRTSMEWRGMEVEIPNDRCSGLATLACSSSLQQWLAAGVSIVALSFPSLCRACTNSIAHGPFVSRLLAHLLA